MAGFNPATRACPRAEKESLAHLEFTVGPSIRIDPGARCPARRPETDSVQVKTAQALFPPKWLKQEVLRQRFIEVVRHAAENLVDTVLLLEFVNCFQAQTRLRLMGNEIEHRFAITRNHDFLAFFLRVCPARPSDSSLR